MTYRQGGRQKAGRSVNQVGSYRHKQEGTGLVRKQKGKKEGGQASKQINCTILTAEQQLEMVCFFLSLYLHQSNLSTGGLSQN